MRGSSWLVVISTFLLEIVAFGLALGAMTRRSKATVEANLQYEYCAYSSDVATGLAAGAVVLLFFGQVVIMGVTSCFCCKSGQSRGKARACAIVAFSLTWFCFIIAELCLVAGARLNKVHTKDVQYFVDDSSSLTCKEIRKSVFAAGAGFTFLTLLFGEIYYLSLAKASEGSWEQGQAYKNGAPTISMTQYP